MRVRPILVRPILIASLLASACGSDDPLSDHCGSACGLPGDHPCTAQHDKCMADCRAAANAAAAQGYKGIDCGTCMADQFQYSGKRCQSATELCTFGGSAAPVCETRADCGADDEQCFGVLPPASTEIPACAALCIEPVYN